MKANYVFNFQITSLKQGACYMCLVPTEIGQNLTLFSDSHKNMLYTVLKYQIKVYFFFLFFSIICQKENNLFSL